MNWRRVTPSYTSGWFGSLYMPFASKKRSCPENWRSTNAGSPPSPAWQRSCSLAPAKIAQLCATGSSGFGMHVYVDFGTQRAMPARQASVVSFGKMRARSTS